ncbi:MAG: carbon monoxide dehydrogenase subunit G [Chloroflexi bacterium]|nr:carbon monoxide dehydrogenase subunit G [Chloroflexota bacterium]
MNVAGNVIIDAERNRVWEFLTDPQGVSSCVPGLESMSVIETDRRFNAIASVGFGNLKVRFSTEVEWLELAKPGYARLKAHGSAPGSVVDVVAEIRLEEMEQKHTALEWSADVTISGTISALASRMMGSVTEKLSAQFFTCVQNKIQH